MKIYFKYIRAHLKRYSIGKTLENLGARYLMETANRNKLIPAMRKMFFNTLCFSVDDEWTYSFSGSDNSFTHGEFVKLYKYAHENSDELVRLCNQSPNGRKVYEWTQNPPAPCSFTGDVGKAYRHGGTNTYYVYEGELKTARGLVISNFVSSEMKRCGKCRKYVIEYYQRMLQDSDGKRYCPKCANDLRTCVSCENICLNDKCGQCSEFYDEIQPYHARPVKFWFFDKLKGKLIKDYSEKGGISKRVKGFYMGDEHEIENYDNEHARDNAYMVMRDYKDELFYATEDGSLNSGFELHTHPSTHKAHVGREWGGMAFIRESGAKSYDTNTAGLHVHLNRNAFTNWHFLKFIKFLMDNIALSLAIGRRKNLDNLNDYSRFDFRFFHDVKKSVINTLRRGELRTHPTVRMSHRGAINLSNSKTIELRFFGGSLNENKYKAKIDFIQAVYEYTAHGSYTNQNAREFVNFVKKDKNRFKHLTSELTTAVFKRAVKFPKETPSELNY